MTREELKNISIERGENSEVTLRGEIPFTFVERQRSSALRRIGEGVKIDGFREGHIPEKVLIERVGEMAVLSQMAELALAAAYPQIIEAHKLETVGYPKIEITKLAPGNPLGFTATVGVMPEIPLPDYKAIATAVNAEKVSDEVSDAEVDLQIADILRQKAAYERLQKKAADGKGATHTHADGTVHEGPAHDEEEPIEDIEQLPVPELTDDLVKTLGQPGQFTDVADFKSKIREHLEVQKKQDNASRHRAAITDKVIEETNINLPRVMIDAEIQQMFAQMEEDLKRAELKMDDYLAHIKKTRDDLRNEWAPSAEKRAKLQLILNAIADKEGIVADAAEADQQIDHLLEHYKDADRDRVRVYVESMLRNEKVMQLLEKA